MSLCRFSFGELANNLGIILFFELLDFLLKGIRSVGWVDWNGFLKEDFAGIYVGRDAVNRHARFFFMGGEDGLVNRFSEE